MDLELVDNGFHGLEELLEVAGEGIDPLCGGGSLGGRLDEALLFQNAEGVPDLVLRELELLGQSYDADGLALHDDLEDPDVSLQQRYL